MRKQITVGDTVEIFENPLSEKKSEGLAILRKLQSDDDGTWDGRTVSRWTVEFLSERGNTYTRSILEKSG